MIDTHCHLNFKAFKNDYREVVSRSFNQGIKGLMIVGSNYETSGRAVEITKEFKNCFVSPGLHPVHVKDEEFNPEEYRSFIRANSGIVKAIGETGLDFYRNQEFPISNIQFPIPKIKDLQREVFLKHTELAKEFELPVILHCRGEVARPIEAYKDLLLVICSMPFVLQGVLHCFSADWQIAQEFLKLGFYIGFTGIITFSNCDDYLLEVIKKTPLEKILIETDAPYLAPEPYRGQRCEPWYVKFTAQKIAEIKKITLEEVIEQTTNNAKELFNV